jgi:uncharacterized protein (TIGR02001 family)
MKRGMCGGVLALAFVVGTAGVAVAQEVEVSGNVAIASDYAFRGISQTLEKPAVQGGFDVSAPFGLYLGMWGSSVNFGEDLDSGARAQMELDIYGGIAPSVGGFDLDLGLLYYAYPGAFSGFDYNFLEVYGGVAREVGAVTAGLTGAFSPDYFGASGTGLFGGVTLGAVLPSAPVAVEGSVGRQSIEDNDAWGTPNYTVWSVGVSTDLLGSTLGATVTGTDLSQADCFGGSDLCKTRVIVSLSRAL